MSDKNDVRQDRRSFLKGVSAIAAAGAAGGLTSACSRSDNAGQVDAKPGQNMMGYVAPKLSRVRIGLIGTGERGSTLLRLLLGIPDADVKAVCDIDPVSLGNARTLIAESGTTGIGEVTGNEYAYRAMLERDDIDAVIIATPWRWHAPMAIDAMTAGKHAFVEVPMATTIDDLWQMVEVSESTRMHCMMMENVCYGRDEMMVLNMVQQGLFGELTHGEGAYIHDLRWQMKELARKTGSWRTYYHTQMRGNIYPTHGLGPIAQYMDTNRGDRFEYMTSMSSPALGRAAYARREFPADHERNRLNYVKGDMNNTLIQTSKGRSILVQYDTTTARPYSRLNLVQGTGGAFAGYPNRIALEDPPDEIRAEYDGNYHQWDSEMEKWYRHFEHPLWQSIKQRAEEAGGHGGMDFVMLWRIVECLRDGLPLDQNVYDGAAWSAIFPLSHDSVIARSKALEIPDFTRGTWKTAEPLRIKPA